MKRRKTSFLLIAILIVSFGLQGCLNKDQQSAAPADKPAVEEAEGIASNTPYHPTNFEDFEVPGDLKQQRDESMFINTTSFKGGVLMFTGWVEVDSLTDFFITSMKNNRWTLSGEIRYENILLSFTKPHKSCLITIYPGEYGSKTKVYAYLTEENNHPRYQR